MDILNANMPFYYNIAKYIFMTHFYNESSKCLCGLYSMYLLNLWFCSMHIHMVCMCLCVTVWPLNRLLLLFDHVCQLLKDGAQLHDGALDVLHGVRSALDIRVLCKNNKGTFNHEIRQSTFVIHANFQHQAAA